MEKLSIISERETRSISRNRDLAKYGIHLTEASKQLPEILFITSYPPRECGIATYSQDLIKAINLKYDHSIKISICPIESDNEQYIYNEPVKYVLNVDEPTSFVKLVKNINENINIEAVMIQHEFGFYENSQNEFTLFLETLSKPLIMVFHTVLPHPNDDLRLKVQLISRNAESIIVMTNTSAQILIKEYGVLEEKITVIQHGTHLVPHIDKNLLKEKYGMQGRLVLSTFGLLSSGKSIETTLLAMPQIIAQNPEVLFLIIGKTHPSVLKTEGEKYRKSLELIIDNLNLHSNVKFVNQFVPLPALLEYLQLTDVYLFTSKDPNQAVSGTFSYAVSCGCAIISTPIPHAVEVLKNEVGVIIDFENSTQLASEVNKLLQNESLRKSISSRGLHKIASTAWENAAIAHANLLEKICNRRISLHYNIPTVNLDHVKKMTTDFGMLQFSVINQPDLSTGYTLDDNARAMVAMCQHYELSKNEGDLKYIHIYLNFLKLCLQPSGNFLNYMDVNQKFTQQNFDENLEDSNGRAIWALGYLISQNDILPKQTIELATFVIKRALENVEKIHSSRAMAFAIKGLYYLNIKEKLVANVVLIRKLADRLVQMYRHESEKDWLWFESYLTCANSILPEALLCAWLATSEPIYRKIAKASFDFLISKIFRDNNINIVSNKTWMQKGDLPTPANIGGEQPIDVAYTIIALNKFYNVFRDEEYLQKMENAFNWFLGNNHLKQIIYNPCTGGCYDGLEEFNVNLNQGAESTVSYLMARLTVQKSLIKDHQLTLVA